jgi:hypothetical protein
MHEAMRVAQALRLRALAGARGTNEDNSDRLSHVLSCPLQKRET